ncbi:hypothetical protein GCM10022223_06860 [Kineosporia mesophila]|uniref:Uncharacterized protein n=1 Tax=Kineosporia mesophila TaxID=566012 RepID=A0ABP6YZH3_9ACTN|nr:hypothetical protein [Kineosporia mesophila]MCD5351065.1 hypothetical protein [Kineosporia mesophila]
MSYDLYFWHTAPGDPEEVADDPGIIAPHPAVPAFRQEIIGLHPDLADVSEPEEGSPDTSKYLALTLPFGWMDEVLPDVYRAARRHGLSGWDPQMEEPPSIEHLAPEEEDPS